MKSWVVGALAGACAMLFATTAIADDAALKASIAGAKRSPQYVARDGARHPCESLTFWGLKPGQTVLEMWPGPGGGYWTEILVPYAKATGGTFQMEGPPDSNTSEDARQYRERFTARYGKDNGIKFVGQVLKDVPLGPTNSVDLVLTARNLHNTMWEGELDIWLKQFFDVLKPGGILAVEEHRADPRPQVPEARDGYVNTSVIVAAAKKAGFVLEDSSEVNANPKDTKDHPFGVWTLPPTNATSMPGDVKPWPGRTAAYRGAEKYKAIGESDRMTLRFKKSG